MTTKYEIEGGIDFYSELYKSIDEKDEDEENVCLITNLPLTEHSVKLQCGHSFNYEPLYNDIVNHKKKFNGMERLILKTMEIRCPYCRCIQKSLLPYYEALGLPKEHGVNYVDELKELTSNKGYEIYNWTTGNCCFEMHDAIYNITTPCPNKKTRVFEATGKVYCYQHYNIAQKKYISQKKMEIKAKEKLAKWQAKMNAKKEKEAVKENAKKQKLEDKLNNSSNKKIKVMNENVIVSNTNSLFLCNQALKTGANKGQECGCKVFQDNLCKRHYNLLNKQI
jgi:uncharacterized Zn finger protein (UPF0148 family)